MIRHRSHAWLTLALNFVREHTPESCTRLCAVLCCLTGCINALGTLAFAHLHAHEDATVHSLVGNTYALIAAGCVALLTRTRSGRGSHPEQGDASAGAAPAAVGGAQ